MRWKTRLVAAAGCAAALSLCATSAFAAVENVPPNPGFSFLWPRPFIPLWANNYNCLSPTRNEKSPWPKILQDTHCVELPHQSYLSFGGRIRLRYNVYTNPEFGIGVESGAPPGSVAPAWGARGPSGGSALASIPGAYKPNPWPHHNNSYQMRIAPYMDAHFFDNKFRLFTQFTYTRYWDNNFYDPNGQSLAEFNQLFVGFKLFDFKNAGGTGILRFGRQEMPVQVAGGNFTTREGPNVRASYDGFRFMWHNKDGYKFQAFAVRPVTLNPHVVVEQRSAAKGGGSFGTNYGSFDDSSDNHTHIYGFVGTVPWMHKAFQEDFYIFNRNQTLTQKYSAPLSVVHLGYAAGQNIFLGGTRLHGDWNNWFYSWDFMYEWGKTGPKDVSAWGVFGQTGYQFKNVMWKPRVTMQTAAFSGDHDPNDNKIGTFDPLYASSGHWYGDGDFLSLSNLISVGPDVMFTFSRQFLGGPSIQALWKQSSADPLYAVGMNPYPGTANDGGSYIGNLYGLFFSWRPDFAKWWTVNMEYTYWDVAGAVKEAGGRNSTSIWIGSNFMW